MFAEPTIREAIFQVQKKIREKGIKEGTPLFTSVDRDLDKAWDHGVEGSDYSKALGYLMRSWSRVVKAGLARSLELPVR